jgi:decaprenylphospho-beta-D-erythro-pentofuranosid-2-ulose 2-reductase
VVRRIDSLAVFGAGSDIAHATVRALVARGATRMALAARHPDRLRPALEELRRGGARTVELVEFDATVLERHEAVVASIFRRLGPIDLVLVAVGVLGPPGDAQLQRTEALELLSTNLLGTVSVVLPVVAHLKAQGHGTLVVLSSVAAERPRAANFLYGASKAGLDAFCQGLGDALAGTGVGVIVVRPGHVLTKMTAHRPAPPLRSTPDAVASSIVAGIRRGAHTVWVPAWLRPVMWLLRVVPRPVFRRLPF